LALHALGDHEAAQRSADAEMAADGLTNREIAQTLFVTAKTVENQLGRAFSKLGLSSRRELGAALGPPAPKANTRET